MKSTLLENEKQSKAEEVKTFAVSNEKLNLLAKIILLFDGIIKINTDQVDEEIVVLPGKRENRIQISNYDESNKTFPLIEEQDEYLEVMNTLQKYDFVDANFQITPYSKFRKRMILLGVIYLMIDAGFFYRTVAYKDNMKLMLSEKEIIKRISESWGLKRADQVKTSKENLIILAIDYIPELNKFFKTKAS